MLAAGGMGGWGGACRASSGNEWARMMIALAAMQGMGKPGSNIWSTTSGVPFDPEFFFPGYAEGGISGDTAGTAAGKKLANRMWPDGGTFSNPQHSPEGQTVPRLRIPEAMNHERLEWHGKGFCGSSIESQFREYHYPAAGYPHVQMYYRYGGSFIGTMTETNRYVRAYREGQIPFVVNQSIWMEGEARFADIVLPACTNFERWDIGDWAHASGYGMHKFEQVNHRLIVLEQQCIEPLGESRSDYEIFAGLADKLGRTGHLHRGRPDRARLGQAHLRRQRPAQAHLLGRVRREGLLPGPGERGPQGDAGAALVRGGPQARHARLGPAALGRRGRQGAGDAVGQDRVRQLEPQAVLRVGRRGGRGAPGDGAAVPRELGGPPHRRSSRADSRCSSSRRTRASASTPWATARTRGPRTSSDHRELKDDGWYYWLIRLNSEDAAARGIADGDLVRAYNDRGAVVLCARVTDRIRPGTAHSAESCSDYAPTGAPGDSPDRAGCVNILTSKRFITPTSPGQACNTCLIEVEHWES